MINRLKIVSNFKKKFIPISSKVAILSTAKSFFIAMMVALLVFIFFQNGVQPYHDIAVGNITMPGVYKNIDFYTYYTFIIVYIIMFLNFNRYYNKMENLKNDSKIELQTYHFAIGLMPVLLVMLFKMNTVSIFNLCFILYIAMIKFLLNRIKMRNDNIVKLITSCFYIYLSLSGALAITSYLLPSIADRIVRYIIPTLWFILCILSCIIFIMSKRKISEKRENFIVDLISTLTQLFVPFCLFSLINSRYYYQGVQYYPVYFSRFNKMVIATIIFLCMYNLLIVYRVIVAKKSRIHSVSLSTIISLVSVCFWNVGYNLVINTDQFHTGETAIVYQQIIKFGQKSGSEFVSVLQGLGLLVSWINEIVFGGTYATFAQANNLVLVIVSLLTVVFLYQIIDDKWLILIIAPIMPLFCMNRTYLIAPVYLFLLNPKIIKKPVIWSYCYILTCIVHVFYQPTYGGVVAVSLIPVLIYIWYNAYKDTSVLNFQTKKNILKMSMFLLSVVVIGILCIPILINAIHFMKVNGFETTIGNGLSVMQTLFTMPTGFTTYIFVDAIIQFIYKFGTGLASIIIMTYMFFRYVLIQKDYIKKIQGIILTMSASISYILMLPAIFNRIDPGISRIGATSFIFFGFLIFILLYLYRNEIRIKLLGVIICGLSLSTGFYITYPPYLLVHNRANTIVNIPDNAIYAKPEETGLDNLGYAFVMNEQYINEAIAINEMNKYLLDENQTYYDLTDKSIYYLLTNKKVPGLYVSPMVATNELIQTEVIERLKENDVPLVFINKPLNYIGVSQSLRSYRIYRYFMEQDYKFVKYKNIDFLVREDVDLTPIIGDIELLDLSSQIGIYDDKIEETSYNTMKLEELTSKKITLTNNIEITENDMYVSGIDPFIVFKSTNNIDFSNIKLVEIKLKKMPESNMKGQLFVATENITENEHNSIHFDIKTNKILIPIYKYEQFNLDTKLVSIRLDFDNVADGTEVTVEGINLYDLNDVQKKSISEQFAEISEEESDNRLDDIFHQQNLMNIPNQWGKSFNLMENRFTESAVAINEYNEIQVGDTPTSTHFNINQPVSGSEGEFLRIKLDYGDNKQRNGTIILSGIDKNDNLLSEEFQFVTVSGNMLIPVASSPNCLQAKELISFDVIFASEEKPYTVKIEEAIMYNLIK